MPEVKVDN